jgi:hypothetical protein
MYQEYKQATQQFVDWIMKASNIKKLPNTLSALRLHVQGIIVSDHAKDFERDRDFSQQLLSALQSGKRAIELRSLVHSIYKASTPIGSDNLESGHGHEEHLFCIKILKECYSTLKTWSATFNRDEEPPEKSTANSDESKPAFLSKFAGLEIEEITETEDSALNLRTAAVQELNFDDVDLKFGDLRLRFICFFLEMIEMEEQVVNTWKRVKSMDISLISATVVTHFAIQRIKMIHSELSLIYPSYSDAISFFSGLKQLLSPLEYEWVSRHTSFQMLHWTLEFYDRAGKRSVPLEEEMSAIDHCRGLFSEGQIYNECTKSPLESKEKHVFNFLHHELALLQHEIVEVRKYLRSDDKSFIEQFRLGKHRAFISSYIREFIQYFESWVPTVPFLFLTLCWIRSVQCLEDSNSLFMYKTIYLYRSFIRRRNTNYLVNEKDIETLKSNSMFNTNEFEYLDDLQELRKSYRSDDRALEFLESWTIQHNHPFLAGTQFLDLLYEDHEVCTVAMISYSQNPRFVPILYRIFQQNGLIERIEYMEDYLRIFEKTLFYNGGQSLPDPLDPLFRGFNYKTYLKLCRGLFLPSQTGKASKLKDESLDKLLPLACSLSKLFAVLRDDDFSALGSKTVFSKEGMEELIKLTESELLGGGYLSMDIFEYFISFNMFVIHIGKTSPQIKQLFQKTGQNYAGNFLLWFQQFFIDYVADYLSKPIKVRAELPEETEIVEHFIELMTSYFNDTDKTNPDCVSEKSNELLFIIPRFGSWEEIYFSKFQEFYTWVLDKLNDPTVNKSGTPSDINNDEIVNEIEKKQSSTVGMECKGVLTSNEKKMTLDPLFSLFNLTMVHPKSRDIDAAEFVFVSYGCFMYLHCREAYNIHLPIFSVCGSGNHWAVDLLLSVSPLDAFSCQNDETGDTPLHYLAKQGHYQLLCHILSLGFVINPALNDEGRRFTYYIKDTNYQSFVERQLDRWENRLHPKTADVPVSEQLPVAENNKSKKSKTKCQDIINREVTEKDEELAKQAEKELLAMIEKEAQQQKKQKPKQQYKLAPKQQEQKKKKNSKR